MNKARFVALTFVAAVLAGACAATPLVVDLLRAGAPSDFVPPAFAAFCQPLGSS